MPNPRSSPVRASGARRRAVALAVGVGAATATISPRAHAQTVAVDEGSFAVTRNGTPIGREEFRILRQPASGGVSYTARAVGAYGTRRISPALQTDAEGAPLRYQVDVRGTGADERVSAQGGAGAHFTAQVQRGAREGAREYLLTPGTVVVDDEAYHQLYFVARRALAGAPTVPVLVPRSDAQFTVAVTRAGTGPVTIAGRSIAATHFTLADASGGWRRELWVDAEGRVLRVLVPSLGLDVVRDDPPR